jgi:predicted nucleotidyltransferase component of viral defense system
MISRFDVEERVREWGLGEHVVEKDFALGWLLWALGTDPVLGEKWVFKGGTCLKKCYVETWRFSEDLDFTVLSDGPVAPDEVLTHLRPVLERAREQSGVDFLAQEPNVKALANGQAARGSVYYRGPRQAPMVSRLNLDLSRLERVVLEPERRRISHAYPDHLPEPGTVLCYAFVEVFAEKIRAMGERGRPRDLYDIVNLFRRGDLREDGKRVREVLAAKCDRKQIPTPTLQSLETASTRAELESEWESMLGHQLPSLPPLESFWNELPRLFAWLEQGLVDGALEPMVAGSEEDASWSQPASVSTWGVAIPFEAIRFAAANRLCVDLTYQGRERRIEPYALRRNRGGRLLLHAIRVDNRGQRSYFLDEIQAARVTQQTFRPAYAVELSAVGPLSAPERARRSPIRDHRSPTAKQPASFEIECLSCQRVFPRLERNAKLRPHKRHDGTPCLGRLGTVRSRGYS